MPEVESYTPCARGWCIDRTFQHVAQPVDEGSFWRRRRGESYPGAKHRYWCVSGPRCGGIHIADRPPGGADVPRGLCLGARRLVAPTLGSLFTGYLLFRFFPQARGSGIPQTKFALFVGEGYISLRTVLGKFFCCATSLASGVALGREGPSVQIGAGIASVLGRRLGLNQENLKALIPMGSSAALATAFNTPIAAVLFSLEEILGDLHAPVLGAVVLSSATSWMVLHLILGDEPLFHVPAYHLQNPAEFGVYVVLGLVGGLGSVFFVKLLLWIRLCFMKFPQWSRWFQPVAGGLLVGILGLFMPEVMGVGYDYVERVLGGDMLLKTLVVLAILKTVATATCYSSGNAGGIFGPSLFIGAMWGGAVGTVRITYFPRGRRARGPTRSWAWARRSALLDSVNFGDHDF